MKKLFLLFCLVFLIMITSTKSATMDYPQPPECSGGNPADVTSAWNPQTGAFESWASCVSLGPNGVVRTIIAYTPCPYCTWQALNPL